MSLDGSYLIIVYRQRPTPELMRGAHMILEVCIRFTSTMLYLSSFVLDDVALLEAFLSFLPLVEPVLFLHEMTY